MTKINADERAVLLAAGYSPGVVDGMTVKADRMVLGHDDGGDWYAGLLLVGDEQGGLYLACFQCHDEIGAADSGCCSACREDMDWRDAQALEAQAGR